MFKSNGRTTPANKKEYAYLKRKLVYCPTCDDHYSTTAEKFSGGNCKVCGTKLKYEGEPDGYKITG